MFFTVSLVSCGSMTSINTQKPEQVAGYTLKNKKELMEYKILHKKSNAIIATP